MPDWNGYYVPQEKALKGTTIKGGGGVRGPWVF